MTETAIKEELSKSYLETIANRTGFFNSTARDFGTDLHIRKAIKDEGRGRYLTTGKTIDIQVKATTEKSVEFIDEDAKDYIVYKVESKTYNDLITRKNEVGFSIPLYLIVFILPEGNLAWLKYSTDDITIKRRAYWFQVGVGEQLIATEKSRKTIKIPKQNLVGMTFFHDAFSRLD